MRVQIAQLVLLIALSAAAGCGNFRDQTPALVGINTRDLIDPPAQADADRLLDVGSLVEMGAEVKKMQLARAERADPGRKSRPPRNVLCLSGGGAYGAFSAGVLVGWTDSGTRPEFDTVTGISTGALIAPLAFLGPKYDADMRRFYTDIRTEDIYHKRTIRGLFTDAIADNSPLGDKIDAVITPAMISEIAAEHRKGRRLYIGTTELEGRRFIVWDIGAIASQSGLEGKDLIKRILLGSSAIPGFFPPTLIPVTVDGRQLVEKHGDGGVSQGIFFRPPYTPDDGKSISGSAALAGTQVWCIVAGKLYADPSPLQRWSLNIYSTGVSGVIYAQTRGDLLRIFTGCILGGMDFHLTAIPEGFDAPKSAAEFNAEPMTRMYNEGYRIAMSGKAWRHTAPGTEPGETVRERASTALTEQRRGPIVDTQQRDNFNTPGPLLFPRAPGGVEK